MNKPSSFSSDLCWKWKEIVYSRESYRGWFLTVKSAQDAPTDCRIRSISSPTSGGFFFQIFFALFLRGFMSPVNLPNCRCVSTQPRISSRTHCCICSSAKSTSFRVVVPAQFRRSTSCLKSTNVWFTLFTLSRLSRLGWNLLKLMMQRGVVRLLIESHSSLVFYIQLNRRIAGIVIVHVRSA